MSLLCHCGFEAPCYDCEDSTLADESVRDRVKDSYVICIRHGIGFHPMFRCLLCMLEIPGEEIPAGNIVRKYRQLKGGSNDDSVQEQ